MPATRTTSAIAGASQEFIEREGGRQLIDIEGVAGLVVAALIAVITSLTVIAAVTGQL